MKPLEIVEARRTAGVDQRELALALGISPQRLSDIERGYSPIPEEFKPRVSTALKGILKSRLDKVT